MKTWTDARLECQKLGADLVSILSTAEQNWLQSYLYMATRDVWTGLNDMVFQGFFVWSDLHMVHFTYWAPGEPNNHVGFNEDCVEMLHQTGRWNDVPCTELNTYICKQPKAHYPAPSIPPTVYGCPQGWDAYAYACYWMEETPKTRSEAKAFCEERDSKLLHILDIYEQSHFTVKLAGYSGFWWIGLRARGSDSGGVDYLWDNDAPLTFTHWDRNQPDSGDGSCVAMTTGAVGGFWDDKACEESFPFVCEGERDGISPPTRAPTPEPVHGCEPGWSAETHFRNCYKFFMMDHSKKKSWNAAGEDCRSRGAELVSIHSPAEELFLSTYSKGKTKWIGLHHNTIVGGYQWSDGSALGHTNWGRGEPNNHQGRENCVEMVSTVNGSSWWNDLYCDAHQDWICEIAKGKKPLIPPVPPSAHTWKQNGTCYYYNDTDVVDFHTAFHRCYAENALLVSIADEAEQAFVNSMVGTGQVSAAWIGMMIAGIAGREYIWQDLSPVTYVHWASGEPNNANGEEQCVQMYRYPGTWNDVNCGRDTAGYVCKKLPGDIHPRPTPTPQWTGNCPEGWKLFGNKCYLFKGDHKNENEFRANWTFAKDWCRTQKGDLVVIDSPYENDFVASYLEDLVMPVWIGLSDIIHEGKFAWIDGSPVKYTNWAEKEPNNNGDQGEHCASMSHSILVTGRWNDDKCHESRGWVCYMKKSSSIPAPPPTTNPCRPGYTSWKNNCYRLSEEQKTWEAAQRACQQDGEGNLASIDQSYDQSFVSGAVLQGESDAWIGLRREENGSSYTWTDGWPVYFTHWGPGEPTNHKGEGCVSMHGSVHLHGLWNDTDCSSPKRYICKISSEKPPPTPAPGDGNCRDGWWPFGRYCYFVENGKNKGYSWPESRHYCQEFWGDLVSVHSRAEVDFLRNLDYTKYHNVWLGLTRDRSFGWAWTDMTSLGFVNWAPGEPNEAFHPGDIGSESCVEMYPDGRWNDNNCMQKRGFACRHRQSYTTNEDGTVNPTDGPSGLNGGVIAGAIIGAVVICALLFGLSYYIIKIWMPTRYPKNDVANFDNPTFGGKS
ncbi:hypothetical protein SKAU_G00357350 [Synaphobranchus kaupii]|uniref:C-type lectin domain-containing protein n=1 Tax=Synaphobranchus kaupii TaxID=118154 RepID=A0A9Q1EHM5_SYNKA|nr:hypothetical protein SKAU_G00357350 [Synaphobranchus kaupii]